MRKKNLVDVGLKMMADNNDDREVTMSLCDDETNWRIWSYSEKATVILKEMNVNIIEGKVAPYYILTPEESVTFMRKFNKAPRVLSDETKERLRENLIKARASRKQ